VPTVVGDHSRVFRLVRLRINPGYEAAFEREVETTISERLGTPGLLSVWLMRRRPEKGPGEELAIASVWDGKESVDRYVAATGGAMIGSDVAEMVETVVVAEYELIRTEELDGRS
jgi:hypothetical protein